MLFCGQSYHVVMSGGHSFPRNAEFLSRAAEFAHFCGISMFLRNFAEFSTGQW